MSDIIARVPTINRKADLDFVHVFSANNGKTSSCRVKIWKMQNVCFVLFIDIGRGTSVTNASEQIVQEIYSRHLRDYSRDYCIFAECYPDFNKDIDLVIPVWADEEVVKVEWKHLGVVDNDLIYE